MIIILYQKIRTLLKYSYFTENFVLYQKIRTPDEQVQRIDLKVGKTMLMNVQDTWSQLLRFISGENKYNRAKIYRALICRVQAWFFAENFPFC